MSDWPISTANGLVILMIPSMPRRRLFLTTRIWYYVGLGKIDFGGSLSVETAWHDCRVSTAPASRRQDWPILWASEDILHRRYLVYHLVPKTPLFMDNVDVARDIFELAWCVWATGLRLDRPRSRPCTGSVYLYLPKKSFFWPAVWGQLFGSGLVLFCAGWWSVLTAWHDIPNSSSVTAM